MEKKKTILRFFMIYMCVLIPLLGTSILITQNFLAQEQKDEQDVLIEQLQEVVTSLSGSFWEYRDKGVALFENKEFSNNLRFSSVSDIGEATLLLNSLNMFDGSGNMQLLYYGDDMLYSSAGKVRPSTFFGRTLNCNRESSMRAMEAINLQEYSITALEYNGGLEYLLFHIPAGRDIQKFNRSMEVIIGVSQMEKMLSSCLYSEGVLLQLNVGDVKGWFYQTESGMKMVSAEEADGLLSGYQSNPLISADDKLQYTVSLWCDMNDLMAGFYELRNMNLISLILGLLISVLLSLVLSVMRFSQLNTLINNITHKASVRREKKHWMKNEFDCIQSLLDEELSNNIVLRKREQYHRKMILKQISALIFNGLLREREEIQSALMISGAELTEDYYFLFGVKVNNREQLKKLEDLFEDDIHYTMNENGRCYEFVLYEVSFKDSHMSSRYEIAEKLQENLRMANIRCEKLAMSQVYSKISMANYAYLEVLSILNNPLDEETKVVCWEKWIQSSNKNVIWHDNEVLRVFRNAVAAKQEQKAMEALTESLRQVNEKDDVRHLRYMFLQHLLLEIDTSDDEDSQQIINEIDSIEVDDEYGYVEGMQRILHKYCDRTKDTGESEKIIQFVQDNFMNYELSLIMVAEYAGLSKSKASRVFKLYTGESYIDYVTRLRMEKAKELLEETDMSVKDILYKVGYLGIENASKKFKAYFKVNPSAYRAQIRKEKGENE